jgi:hypothetical protein
MGPNGETSAEMSQTQLMIMMAVTMVTTVLLGGVVWLVLSLAG